MTGDRARLQRPACRGGQGFSLIEILVAASIFTVAITAASSLFVAALEGQRHAIAQQNLLANLRFATEIMTRQIRMAQQDDESGSCTSIAKATYGGGGSNIRFVAYDGDCMEYSLDLGGRIVVQEGGGGFEEITSDDINVTLLNFDLQGELVDDNEQPRVTIFIEAADSGEILKLQTTVSGRNIDVP